MKSRRYNQDGFTLIEIMVVILILGLLATIVVQSLRGAADKAKKTKAQADLAEIKTALDRYYLDNGYLPEQRSGFDRAGFGADQRPGARQLRERRLYRAAAARSMGDPVLLPERRELVRSEVVRPGRGRKRGRYRRQPNPVMAP